MMRFLGGVRVAGAADSIGVRVLRVLDGRPRAFLVVTDRRVLLTDAGLSSTPTARTAGPSPGRSKAIRSSAPTSSPPRRRARAFVVGRVELLLGKGRWSPSWAIARPTAPPTAAQPTPATARRAGRAGTPPHCVSGSSLRRRRRGDHRIPRTTRRPGRFCGKMRKMRAQSTAGEVPARGPGGSGLVRARPGGSKIYDAYDKHVERCKEAASAAASSVQQRGSAAITSLALREHAEHASTVK